jgi:hypothetical protein
MRVRFYVHFQVALLVVAKFLHWLVSSIYGSFLLTLALYWWLIEFTSFRPLTPSELLLWFDSLKSDDKTAIATALITVIGFLVAFQTGYSAARLEALMQMEHAAASAFTARTNEFGDTARHLMGFARTIEEAHHDAATDPSLRDSIAKFLTKEAPTHVLLQQRLLELATATNNLSIDWHYVLMRHLGAPWHAVELGEIAGALVAKADFVPDVAMISPNASAEQVLRHFSVEGARAYLDAYDLYGHTFSRPLSRIRAPLLGHTLSANVAAIVNYVEIQRRGKRGMI